MAEGLVTQDIDTQAMVAQEMVTQEMVNEDYMILGGEDKDMWDEDVIGQEKNSNLFSDRE